MTKPPSYTDDMKWENDAHLIPRTAEQHQASKDLIFSMLKDKAVTVDGDEIKAYSKDFQKDYATYLEVNRGD